MNFAQFNRKSLVLALATVAAVLSPRVHAIEYDLTAVGSQSLNVVGAYGGTAVVQDHWSQPTGTGVFKPFLSLQGANGNANTEHAYNTDGFTNLFMDANRPQWNNRLKVGDLETVTFGSLNYFAFVLDANEPGGDKSLISVDNIRIYTSATDNTTSVGNNVANLDNLGTLRWAMNTPTTITTTVDVVEKIKGKEVTTTTTVTDFNKENWIKLDAGQENTFNNSNGGSGMADLVVFIPQSAFAGVSLDDYLWFYNLNGAHYSTDIDLASQSGFEEWSAYTRTTPVEVPENGTTAILLGAGMILGSLLRRKTA